MMGGQVCNIREKSYEYGWLDKVTRILENGKEVARFEYHNNNQLSKVVRENGVETFEWDGLALIERNGTKYINEPHAGGGNPILAIVGDGQKTEAIFTDILGTSMGKVSGNGYSAIDKTSFGADTSDKSSFFTGKPYVEGLGYAFLFRNYRADMGKWLSQDLIGYPDGWNNLSYCKNNIIKCIDYIGAYTISSVSFSNITPVNNSEFTYTAVPNSYISVPVSGRVSFSVSKEANDGPNVAIRVVAQSDNTSIYDSINKTFTPDENGKMVITYNFEGVAFAYRGDGGDSGKHWFRFGIAVEKTTGNFTSSNLSSKHYFILKERKEAE